MEATTSLLHDWSSLPVKVLVRILDHLRWSSHPSFGIVCRQWQSARARVPFYPAWISPLLLNTTSNGTTNVRYYSPYYHKNFETACTLNIPGARIIGATAQHLTLCREHLILDAQLLFGDVLELPKHDRPTFDSVVYDGVRTMFGVHSRYGWLKIGHSIRNNEIDVWGEWSYTSSDCDGPCSWASQDCSNPVLHDGFLYLLNRDGALAVYDERKHDKGLNILEKPGSFTFEHDDSYLVKSDHGELMAVLIGRRGTPVNIVKLNEHTMEWEKIQDLEGRTLFTGTLTTTMKKTNIKWMQNKVFRPRLYDWPDTVHVDLVQREGEVAFVPKSGRADTLEKQNNYGTNIWSYKLGQSQEPREFWGIRM
ncbi:uncharacterized protein [Lolium perenne]|uniref:uncharacterized protein n=1 Tax=Lolium perenne TaxID=4522 RepID=UPI0021F56027|nr:uncharacterized protein LOC127303910 [Lolium perenne]